LFAKVVEFVGGKANIDAVNGSRVAMTMSMNTPQGAMSADSTTILQYPHTLRQDMTLPMGTVTTVITPTAAFAITPMGTQDLPASRRDATVLDMKTDFFHILRHVNPKYTLTAGGTEKIGDVETRILEISPEGGVVRWYIEPATGRLVRTVRSTQMGETTTDYSEWKRFGALQMPTLATVTRGGEKAGEARVTAVEINPTVDAKLFVKP
jgi:hypothetical protein